MRAAARSGIAVSVATTRDPESFASDAAAIGAQIIPTTLAEAAKAGVVFLAVRFESHADVRVRFPTGTENHHRRDQCLRRASRNIGRTTLIQVRCAGLPWCPRGASPPEPRRVLEGGQTRCSKFGASVGQSHELMYASKTLCGAAMSTSLGERQNVRAITSAPYGVARLTPDWLRLALQFCDSRARSRIHRLMPGLVASGFVDPRCLAHAGAHAD